MKKVTAAIIEKNGKILITQRPRTDKLSLKWEFPGGKVESGETPEECLVREIKEELNLDIKITGHFMNSNYKYESGEIELICYFAEITGGEITLNFHETAKWIERGNLKDFDFAPADIPVWRCYQEGGG
ncbi:MAG: (deoxy)nucleoside triphosphate pyrophosphohydrolase [Clostridiales bacterium]|nr:(deoxy)nucleoside triphosphate pyrophosphohydrolase [Clostridiales bacterium]MCF8022138.1 (deoxy)nucleoside triphosphate pyrophosphohydrolase [Clostridiales bacterium]